MSLGWKDKLGYDFEFENRSAIVKSGLSGYMVYCNPQNPYLWKKKKQKGVDKIFHVGKYRIYVEERFQSCFYYYRTSWFQKSTLQRFANYPHTKYDMHVVLTNRSENYQSVRQLAKSQGVDIMSIDELLHLIHQLAVNTIISPIPYQLTNNTKQYTKHNNVYGSKEYSIKYNQIMKGLVRKLIEMKLREDKRLRELYSG